MNHELVLATLTKNHIGILTLNRPEKHNAFNAKMIAEIIQKLLFFKNQPIKFLMINAKGENFSAGADLNWMHEMATSSFDKNLEDASQLARMLNLIYHFEKPTIALVQGSALGGGAGIVAACDIAIASDDTVFGFTETKLGLVPAIISPYVIHAIGTKWTNYYFLTAELFNAHTAYKIGLCQEIVSLEELLAPEHLMTIKNLIKNGPLAIQHVKTLIHTIGEKKINDLNLIPITANIITQLRASKEGQEGISAFLEKRAPNWIIKE